MAKQFEERVTSAKRIYDGKVVNLRVDTVVLPGGKMAQREVVEHAGAVAIVPLKDDGTVILVRQWRTPARAALLEIPAGSLDPDEAAEAAAGRELGEEINFQAGRMTKLFATYQAPGYSTEIIHTFLAEELTPFQGEPDEDENIEIVTMTLAEAIEKIKTGEITDAKSVSGLLWVERMQREGGGGVTRRETAVAAGLLALATALVLWPWLFAGRALYWGDFGLYFQPLMRFLQGELRQGIVPLWNPHLYSGTPFVGNPQMWPLYPATLLLPLLPPSAFLTVSCALHVWLAGVFFFAFLRGGRLHLSFGPSLLGALGFMFGGYLVTRAQYPNMLQALAYVPLVLLTAERMTMSPGPRTSLALGVAFGLQLLAAHAQISLYTLYLALTYVALCLWARPERPRPFWMRFVGWGAAGLIFALALDGAQWLPVLAAHPWTARQTLTIARVDRMHLPLAEWTNFALPYRYGTPMRGDWSGPSAFWEIACYAGTLTFVLAVLGTLHGLARLSPRRADVAFWLLMFVGSTWLALGARGGLFRLAYAVVPGMRFFHDPARLLLGAALALPLLGAVGLEGLLAALPSRRAGGLAAGILLLTCLDLGYYDRGLYPLKPVAEIEGVASSSPVAQALCADPMLVSGAGRILTIDNGVASDEFLSWTTFGQGRPDYLSRLASTMTPNQPLAMGLSDVGGYEPLALQNSLSLFMEADRAVQAQNADPRLASFLGRLGVRAVIAYRPRPLASTPGLTPQFAWTDPDRRNTVFVYRNSQFLPRARYVWADGARAEAPKPAALTVDEPDHVAVALPASPRPARLTLADTAFPGWAATLDGRPVLMDQANGFYRVVTVPPSPGPRRVEFRYDPLSFRLGLYLTGLALTVLAAAVAFLGACGKRINRQERRWEEQQA